MWSKGGRPVWLAASASLLTYGVATTREPQEQTRKRNSQAPIQEKIERASRLIQSRMVVQGIPGLSVAIAVNGDRIWSSGFGYANLETATPCSPDSVMRIASISKPITAAIAASLVQDGKLDLDEEIKKYLPDFPKKKYDGKEVSITTRQLLSHTGGIRHYEKKSIGGSGRDIENPANNNTAVKEFLLNTRYESVTDAVKMFAHDELVAEPGTKFSYTTHGLTLASAVLEKASGLEYPRLVQQLCHRLQLRNTHLDVNKRIIPNRTSYYVRVDGVLENCQEVDNSYKWAGGGLLSNTTDLLTFGNALIQSYHGVAASLLSRTVLGEFWKASTRINDTTSAALGWMRIEDGQQTSSPENAPLLWYHTGAAVGASSVLLIRPSCSDSSKNTTRSTSSPTDLCLVMLCNLQDTSLLNLARDVQAIFDE